MAYSLDPRMLQMAQAGMRMLGPTSQPFATPTDEQMLNDALARANPQTQAFPRTPSRRPDQSSQSGQPTGQDSQQPLSLLSMLGPGGGAGSPLAGLYGPQGFGGLGSAGAAVAGPLASPWAYLSSLGNSGGFK